jgi:2-polyprenyl-3-methyl-5-hydroxy-6-metoxy-1,4-benzoquinol methylase
MDFVPSPPSIAFHPPLALQRQAFLLETLRGIKPKSVLDVGCGDGRLLDCLVRCDEALPVELLAGIDISLTTLQQASRSIEVTADDQQIEGRWRPLDIYLLHGISLFGNK